MRFLTERDLTRGPKHGRGLPSLAISAALALALTASACQDRLPTAERGSSTAANASQVPARSSAHRALVRRMAAALKDNPDLRTQIDRDMESSPVHEGKLLLRDYLRGGGESLLASLRSAARGQEKSVLSLVDEAPGGVEMYIPVDEHRDTWEGGEDLIVATMVGEDSSAEVYGVTLDGQEVDLDRDDPPSTPTLVLVPAEGFRPSGEPRPYALRPPPSLRAIERCLIDCGGGGSGGGFTCSDGSAGGDRGIGIQETIQCIRYNIEHEPWPSGNPEFYILLSGTSDADEGDELDKEIHFPDYIWDNVDAGEYTEWTQDLALWDTDWGTRVKVQCFESDADADDLFNLTGNTTATAETTFAAPGTDVQFTGSFQVGLDSADEDDNCAQDYIPVRTSEGDWIEIPDGSGPSANNQDGTSDLQWFGKGEDITA